MSKAYIEDFGIIKFITNDIDITSIILCDKDYQDIEEINIPKYYLDNYGKNYFLNYQTDLKLYFDYYLKINNNEFVHLYIGKITRSNQFDELYQSNVELGCFYHKNETTFRIWSPISKVVNLYLYNNNEDKVKYSLKYTDHGVYEITLKGDYEGYHYYYEIRINEAFHKTNDPYAYSSTINYNEGIVTNLTRIKSNKHQTISGPLFIDEINIRDITSFNMGGTFIDLVNQKEKLLYLKSQGINTIQIMPVYGFGGVDENKNFDYNWGYNPIQYFSFSRYLTSNKEDYFGPIDEFNQLVNLLHEYNFNVVLDVVFNHVYNADENALGIICPGYSYHYKSDGYLTNDSGCGNDLNTQRLMIRKLIIDCLKYYVKYFNIDGFRFDLMGLMDIETINLAKEELKKLNPNIIFYGEGWDMSSSLKQDAKAIIHNQLLLDKVGFFNDSFRETIKNHFLLGEKLNSNDLLNVLNSSVDYHYFKDNELAVNYIECHDDKTVFDTLKSHYHDLSIAKIDDYLSLGICLVTLANGISFYHLGQEFGRSKKGIQNSYQAGDFINRVDFEQASNYHCVNTMKEIIQFKKDYLKDNHYKFFNLSEKTSDELSTEYYFKLAHDGLDKLIIVIKNNYLKSNKYLVNKLMLFNKNTSCNEKVRDITFNEPGVWIFKI